MAQFLGSRGLYLSSSVWATLYLTTTGVSFLGKERKQSCCVDAIGADQDKTAEAMSMYELSAVATQAMPSTSGPLAAFAQGAKSRAVHEVGTFDTF